MESAAPAAALHAAMSMAPKGTVPVAMCRVCKSAVCCRCACRWSFCGYTLSMHTPKSLVVHDALTDGRFCDNVFGELASEPQMMHRYVCTTPPACPPCKARSPHSHIHTPARGHAQPSACLATKLTPVHAIFSDRLTLTLRRPICATAAPAPCFPVLHPCSHQRTVCALLLRGSPGVFRGPHPGHALRHGLDAETRVRCRGRSVDEQPGGAHGPSAGEAQAWHRRSASGWVWVDGLMWVGRWVRAGYG